MKIPFRKIFLIFGIISLVMGIHLASEVSRRGWKTEAVVPVVLAFCLCSGIILVVIRYAQKPISGVDPESKEAWQIRFAPLLRWLVPAMIAIKVLLVITKQVKD